MRKVSTFILIILFYFNFFAQNFTKGFNYIKTRDYLSATKFFSKYTNSKNSIVAYYGLAIVYSLPQNKFNNLKTSYDYCLKSKELLPFYTKLQIYDFTKKYGLSPQTIDTLINFIINDEYNYALQSQNRWSYFINSYSETKQAKQLENIRDSVYFFYVVNNGTIYDFDKYIKDFPNSKFNKKAQTIRDSIWKSIYYDYFRGLEYNSIVKFKKQYPDFPFYDDSTYIYTNLAVNASNLKLYLGFSTSNVPYYSHFIKLTAPHELAFQTLLTLISPNIQNNQIQQAIDTILTYNAFFGNSVKIDSLLSILKRPEAKLKSNNLSANINTKDQEYMPVVTADDSTIYFCATDRADNIGMEDIFVSKLQSDGQWTKPEYIAELSKPYSNEAPLSISPDGNTMLIFKNGDIYISNKTAQGWSKISPIQEINTSNWEADAIITPDGNAIIFASDRPDGIGQYHAFSELYHGDYIGNIDLYVIVKQTNGSWSNPINLGPKINTPYAERTPFLHYDMKTLYFASDGWSGVGKTDIFKTTRLNDSSWTDWTTPINLGLEINTQGKEYGYKISVDGTKAYFTKIINNNSDIYETELPVSARPQQVAIIEGYVTDKNTNKPLEADIVWENLSDGNKLGTMKTDPITGKYTITLPVGKNYGFYVSKEKYYPLSQNIDLTTNERNISIRQDFKLIPLENILQGTASVELKNIFFDYDKFELKSESFPELDRLIEFIMQQGNIKIEIDGFTDNKGTNDYNFNLSQKRADAVKNYLISKGVNANQLISKGYGSQNPVATNDTDEGRQLNRRVEFKVVK